MTPEQDVFDVPVHQGAPPVQQDADDQNDSQNDGQHGSQNAPPGMGQSKSSRRRRRKRKNKGVGAAQAGPAAPVEGSSDGQPIAVQAAAATQSAPAQSSQAPQQNQQPGQQQQGGGSGKRWKKKHRDRQRQAPDPNPGNNFSAGNGGGSFSQNNGNGFSFGNGGGGFKRKNKQRKERGGFVGPMDHSYRVANGNFADGPPSTIEVHGNYHQRSHGPRHTGDSQPIDYSLGKSVPIPEGTPTKIYFFIEDLFFLAKIQETARKLGVKVAFVKNEKEVIDDLTSGEEVDRPALIVFDLNNLNAKPLTLIPKLKAKLKRSTSIIGFLSHLQGDLKAKAVEAGCDTVMPRSAFSQNLPNLLRRYGLEDEDEPNYNQ